MRHPLAFFTMRFGRAQSPGMDFAHQKKSGARVPLSLSLVRL